MSNEARRRTVEPPLVLCWAKDLRAIFCPTRPLQRVARTYTVQSGDMGHS